MNPSSISLSYCRLLCPEELSAQLEGYPSQTGEQRKIESKRMHESDSPASASTFSARVPGHETVPMDVHATFNITSFLLCCLSTQNGNFLVTNERELVCPSLLAGARHFSSTGLGP